MSQFLTALGQPGVEFRKAVKAGGRRERPFTDMTDLILYLSLFPTRLRGARHGLEHTANPF